MMGTESNIKVQPKVVKLEKAFKLAEKWVDKMNGSTTSNDLNALEFVGRPERLGLGAKIIPNARASFASSSTDPVERKLMGKLNAIKQNSRKISEESAPIKGIVPSDSDDDDEAPESRIKAFSKKRAQLLAMPKNSFKKSK